MGSPLGPVLAEIIAIELWYQDCWKRYVDGICQSRICNISLRTTEYRPNL